MSSLRNTTRLSADNTLTTALNPPGECQACGVILSCLRACLTSNCVKWPVMETCSKNQAFIPCNTACPVMKLDVSKPLVTQVTFPSVSLVALNY